MTQSLILPLLALCTHGLAAGSGATMAILYHQRFPTILFSLM